MVTMILRDMVNKMRKSVGNGDGDKDVVMIYGKKVMQINQFSAKSYANKTK